MMEDQKSKEMGRNTKDAAGKRLVCIRECWAPGYGHWKPGDVVTDEKTISYLDGNINFEPKEA